MTYIKPARRGVALVAMAAATTLVAAGCSAGSLGSSGGGGGSAGGTTITFLTTNDDPAVKSANALIAAFKTSNPDITIKVDTRPGGSDGDNLVKTKLATGDMAEVFNYNNGSLFQALKPAQNLTPMDDQPWVTGLQKLFVDSTTADGKIYGAPYGTAFGGGVLYNKPVYAKLGLKVPKTWTEFMANNDAIKKAGGITPVEATYGDTWTSQLPVLADYANVEAAVPDFAAQYTAGKAKYATTPAALAGFQHIQQLHDGGYFNKDFASAKFNDGLKDISSGKAAHYPQIGSVTSGLDPLSNGHTNDVGIFAWPGTDASKNILTAWSAGALYVPKAVEGAKADAAKKFIAFAETQAGCDAFEKDSPPTGPFMNSGCKLPSEVTTVAKDTSAYFDAGKVSPALEFKSPIKGPNLEQICIQVGTGQVNGEKGAALYDEDVKKQAQQLGLPGW